MRSSTSLYRVHHPPPPQTLSKTTQPKCLVAPVPCRIINRRNALLILTRYRVEQGDNSLSHTYISLYYRGGILVLIVIIAHASLGKHASPYANTPYLVFITTCMSPRTTQPISSSSDRDRSSSKVSGGGSRRCDSPESSRSWLWTLARRTPRSFPETPRLPPC